MTKVVFNRNIPFINRDDFLTPFDKIFDQMVSQHYPEITKANEIEFALVWNPKEGVLAKLPNLKVIFSIGAGVDHILRDKSIPKEIPIIRMSDPFQYKMVAEYALLTVLYDD